MIFFYISHESIFAEKLKFNGLCRTAAGLLSCHLSYRLLCKKYCMLNFETFLLLFGKGSGSNFRTINCVDGKFMQSFGGSGNQISLRWSFHWRSLRIGNCRGEQYDDAREFIQRRIIINKPNLPPPCVVIGYLIDRLLIDLFLHGFRSWSVYRWLMEEAHRQETHASYHRQTQLGFVTQVTVFPLQHLDNFLLSNRWRASFNNSFHLARSIPPLTPKTRSA